MKNNYKEAVKFIFRTKKRQEPFFKVSSNKKMLKEKKIFALGKYKDRLLESSDKKIFKSCKSTIGMFDRVLDFKRFLDGDLESILFHYSIDIKKKKEKRVKEICKNLL